MKHTHDAAWPTKNIKCWYIYGRSSSGDFYICLRTSTFREVCEVFLLSLTRIAVTAERSFTSNVFELEERSGTRQVEWTGDIMHWKLHHPDVQPGEYNNKLIVQRRVSTTTVLPRNVALCGFHYAVLFHLCICWHINVLYFSLKVVFNVIVLSYNIIIIITAITGNR